MHRIPARLLIVAAVCFATASARSDEGYKVDERKLPDWVRRQAESPYRVIRDSSVVRIRPAAAAASPALAAGRRPSAAPVTAAMPALAASHASPRADVTVASAPVEALASVASTDRPVAPASSAPSGPAETRVAAVAPAPRTTARIGEVCPAQVAPRMPRAAEEQHLGGTVKARALVQGGQVREVTILSGPAVFHGAVRAAMKSYRCREADSTIAVVQDFVFEAD